MEHRATIDGRTVRWLEVGEGPVLLLLHAFPLAADMWAPQLAAAPAGWRLVAPDLRGFGGSERGVSPARSMDDHARDAIALLDHLHAESAAFAGLSMGGYICFALCRLAPHRVRGLLLADTRTEPDSDEARANRLKMLQAISAGGAPAVAETMLPRLLGETSRRDRPDVVARVRTMIEANGADGIADAVAALMSRPDSSSTLAAFRGPVHLVVGREDELTPVALHEQMKSAAARAELTVVDGAGHLSNLEQPAAFNRALARFLSAPA